MPFFVPVIIQLAIVSPFERGDLASERCVLRESDVALDDGV